MVTSDSFDASQKLAGHSFTAQWLVASLRKNDKLFQKLHGKSAIKNITAFDVSGGKGFLSIVLRCTLTFVENSEDSYTTILKIPGFESFKEISDEMKIQIPEYHKLECDFYEQLAPILGGPTPKVYQTLEWILGEQEGCIHMEDLTARGRTMSYFESVNLAQIRDVIRHLAHMHKNILSADPGIWKGKFMKGANGFVDFLKMVNSSVEPLMGKSSLEDVLRPFVNKYHTLCRNTDFYIYAYRQSHLDLHLPSIIAQGDMHPGNIMWIIDAQGILQNSVAAIVDWQTMQESSPMTDLARFLVHCADGNIRRQAEGFGIEFYFECLCQEFGDPKKVPYTLVGLQTAYKYSFLAQALYTIGLMSFFVPNLEETIEDENAKKAFYDYGMLKSLHAYQDAEKLLEGEMSHLFVKYGQ